MTPAATPEALEQALAVWILKRWPTTQWQAAAKAKAILAGPLAPVLADLQRVTDERDEARAKQRDMHRRAQKAESFRERHRGGFNYLMNGKRKERFGRCAAEAALATAAAEAASLRAEVEAKDRARDDALKAAIRAWSAKLHIPVTRMMSRELRAEFSAALARAGTAGEGRSDG